MSASRTFISIPVFVTVSLNTHRHTLILYLLHSLSSTYITSLSFHQWIFIHVLFVLTYPVIVSFLLHVHIWHFPSSFLQSTSNCTAVSSHPSPPCTLRKVLTYNNFSVSEQSEKHCMLNLGATPLLAWSSAVIYCQQYDPFGICVYTKWHKCIKTD